MAAERDWSKSTLGERIEYAMKVRGVLKDAHAARAAGMLPSVFCRLKKNQRDKGSAESLEKIAAALTCDLRWLSGGVGKAPNDGDGVPDPMDPCPSREQACRLMRGAVDDQVLEAVRAEPCPDGEDPGRANWLELIRALQHERNAQVAALSERKGS